MKKQMHNSELENEAIELLREYAMFAPERVPQYTDTDFDEYKHGWTLAFKMAFVLQETYAATDQNIH